MRHVWKPEKSPACWDRVNVGDSDRSGQRWNGAQIRCILIGQHYHLAFALGETEAYWGVLGTW